MRYGPWYGTIISEQSCYVGVPDRWSLSSSVLAMTIEWEGGPNDMPSVPNLSLVWDPGQPATVTQPCCPGYSWCPATQSCLDNRIDCPDLTPA